MPPDMQLFNYLSTTYSKRGTIKLKTLFYIAPFSFKPNRQYPGNVIQYSLMTLASVLAQNDNAWAPPIKSIFNIFCSFLNKETLKTFTPKDCAVSLAAMANIIPHYFKDTDLEALEDSVLSLLSQLRLQIHKATPKELSVGLRALGVLAGVMKLPSEDTARISLIHELHKQREQATGEDIGIALWGMVKLVQAEGALFSWHSQYVNDFLESLYTKEVLINLDKIVGTLSALANLVEVGAISRLNSNYINSLVSILYKNSADPEEIASTLWALGTISHLIESKETLLSLVGVACSLLSNTNEKPIMRRILRGIYLLNLDDKPWIRRKVDLKACVRGCRPKFLPTWKQGIECWLDANSKNFPSSKKNVEYQPFIRGYFVDALILLENGEQIVMDIEKSYDRQPSQKLKKAYRDERVLRPLGYQVIRVTVEELDRLALVATLGASFFNVSASQKSEPSAGIQGMYHTASRRLSIFSECMIQDVKMHPDNNQHELESHEAGTLRYI